VTLLPPLIQEAKFVGIGDGASRQYRFSLDEFL
jgi:hypothetical protein